MEERKLIVMHWINPIRWKLCATEDGADWRDVVAGSVEEVKAVADAFKSIGYEMVPLTGAAADEV